MRNFHILLLEKCLLSDKLCRMGGTLVLEVLRLVNFVYLVNISESLKISILGQSDLILLNFGNVYQCSRLMWTFSLVQALYFCAPFREQLLEYCANNKSVADSEENLLTCLADLFSQVIMMFQVWFSYYGPSHFWPSNSALMLFRLVLRFYPCNLWWMAMFYYDSKISFV